MASDIDALVVEAAMGTDVRHDLRTLLPAYETLDGAPALPLYAYSAVGVLGSSSSSFMPRPSVCGAVLRAR